MNKSLIRISLILPFIFLWLGFFLVPVLMVFRVSFFEGGGGSGFGIGGEGGYYKPGTWSLSAFHYLLTDTTTLKMISFNVMFGLLVATISFLVGLLLSVYINESSPQKKMPLVFSVIIPKFANLLVTIYGLKLILSNSGPINNFLTSSGLFDGPVDFLNSTTSAVIGKTYLIIPYVVLILTSRFIQIDQHQVICARSLGANTWNVYRKIIFPLSFDALQLSFFISLVWGIGAFASPLFLGSPNEWTLSVEIQRQVFEYINWPKGAALAVILFVIFLSVSGMFWLITNRFKKWLFAY